MGVFTYHRLAACLNPGQPEQQHFPQSLLLNEELSSQVPSSVLCFGVPNLPRPPCAWGGC